MRVESTSSSHAQPPEDVAGADGAVAVALASGSLGVLLLCGAVALVAGLPWWQAALLALTASMAVSASAGVAVATLATRRSTPAAPVLPAPRRSPSVGPAGGSSRRAAAGSVVTHLERQLVRAVERQADPTDLMSRALALHEARLRLARILLAEDGDLPQELKDELVVAHRGVATWLEADAAP